MCIVSDKRNHLTSYSHLAVCATASFCFPSLPRNLVVGGHNFQAKLFLSRFVLNFAHCSCVKHLTKLKKILPKWCFIQCRIRCLEKIAHESLERFSWECSKYVLSELVEDDELASGGKDKPYHNNVSHQDASPILVLRRIKLRGNEDREKKTEKLQELTALRQYLRLIYSWSQHARPFW